MALARSTGCVSRALSTEGAFQEAPAAKWREEFPVRGWFLELLKPWTNVGWAPLPRVPGTCVSRGGRLD